jgi:hypothetical protein
MIAVQGMHLLRDHTYPYTLPVYSMVAAERTTSGTCRTTCRQGRAAGNQQDQTVFEGSTH